ncbi:MAG: glycosyltransferase family 2 protein [Bryobacterales bacterium]|nr:glycosyltransferase [Bryobacteraceae bacterium]MDW8355903.1 glycosyltransferase family 2 protein [Bryobacterales bacterium]
MSFSVVIASKVELHFLEQCLRSLEGQVAEARAETIVVAAGPPERAERIRTAFPWVRVMHHPGPATVPQLRRLGVMAAQGELVGIIEEHCVAEPGWIVEAQATHSSGHYGAVGGPVLDNGYKRRRDWVVYFCEYSGFLPPFPDREYAELNGANIAYRRRVLLEHADLLEKGFWEAALHPVLLAKGIRFRAAPRMRVRHCGPFPFGYYLRQRYLFSRAFAGARRELLAPQSRLAYLVAAPAVPLLLLLRMARRVGHDARLKREFVRTLPWIAVALTVYAAGEWVGYAAGPGQALLEVE